MANITGLITVNGKDILEVDADPSAGAGTPAPRASLAMFDNGAMGQLFVKTGTADTAWSASDTTPSWDLTGNALTGGSPSTPNEFFGSTNDFDVITRRNNIEQMRIQSSAILVGLAASLGGRLQINDNTAGTDMLKEILNSVSNPVIKVNRLFRLTTVGAGTANFSIAVPNDNCAKISTGAVLRQTAGATGAVGDGAAFDRTITAKNVAGTTTAFQEQNDYTYKIDTGISFVSSVSGANVVYTGGGVANRNFSWGLYVSLLIVST